MVWSRIDTEQMKAVPLPFTKLKLQDIARELYLEHGWTMPRGFASAQERDPRNFSLSEWQQAKRAGHDPRAIKAVFQDAWAISDSKEAFINALRIQYHDEFHHAKEELRQDVQKYKGMLSELREEQLNEYDRKRQARAVSRKSQTLIVAGL